MVLILKPYKMSQLHLREGGEIVCLNKIHYFLVN